MRHRRHEHRRWQLHRGLRSLRILAALFAALLFAGGCLPLAGCSSDADAPVDRASSEGIADFGADGGGEPGGDVDEPAQEDPSENSEEGAETSGELGDLGDEVPPEGSEPEGAALAVRLDAYLEESFPQTGVPGAAVAVVDSQGVRYLRTFGDCVDECAPFLIGSLSKSFTAVAVMQLVEEGAVDLDAPAATYAPEYGTPLAVTVRDLLNQTSGFGYYDSLAEAQVGDVFGTFSYANANYDLLGRIVEAVSGQSYSDYLKGHVLQPLGMADSSADMAEALETGMTPGHRTWFGVPVADGFVHASSDDSWGSAPSGYVASSVLDMASYLQMYLNAGSADDGVGVLSAESVSAMFLDRVPDPDGDTFYGMGWTSFCWDDGEIVLSHDGQVENYVASMCLLPERDLGVIVLGDASDSVGGDSLFFEMVSGVVAASVGAAPDPVDGTWVKTVHQRNDVVYAWALIVCLLPLLLLPAWKRRLDGCLPVVAKAEPVRDRACPVASASAERVRSKPIAQAVARRKLLARAILLHVAVPIFILLLPFFWGIKWRDLLDFAPDVSVVLIGCAVLLALGGAVKAVLVGMGFLDSRKP